MIGLVSSCNFSLSSYSDLEVEMLKSPAIPHVMRTTRRESEDDGCNAVHNASGSWILFFAILLFLLKAFRLDCNAPFLYK